MAIYSLSSSTTMCRFFGKPGSAYDFSASDMGRLKEKARELEEQQKGMKKKVNPKVLHTIDRYARFVVCSQPT